MTQSLSVAIYSYNRGPWLANCIASVRRNLGFAAVVVLDDGSDDAATRQVLDQLDPSIRLIRPPTDADGGRHGGLYANMQRMLDLCETTFLLNVQDDTQIVRRVSEEEFAELTHNLPRLTAAFCSPLFTQGRASRRAPRIELIPNSRCFFQYNSSVRNPQPLAYRDVSLCDVSRLRGAGFQFGASEHKTARVARSLFGPMPILADPFVAFVPEVPTFRLRHRTLGARIAEGIVGRSVKPYLDMTDESVARLRAQSTAAPALASAYLQTVDPDVKSRFEPNAVDVFQSTRLLNKAEIGLRRLVSKPAKEPSS